MINICFNEIFYHRDERHPRPGTKRPREDDEEEEEDLNESNYDEVRLFASGDYNSIFCTFQGLNVRVNSPPESEREMHIHGAIVLTHLSTPSRGDI